MNTQSTQPNAKSTQQILSAKIVKIDSRSIGVAAAGLAFNKV